MIGEVAIDDASVLRAFDRAPHVMHRVMDRYAGRAGLELARAIRSELAENKSVGTSLLMQSIHVERPFPSVRDVRAGAGYGKAVEEGTDGGYKGLPPLKPLAAWIKAKDNVSDIEAHERAGGLAWYIKQHGTKPHPYFEPAFEKKHSRLTQLLREGAAQGVREVFGTRGN